MRGKIALGKNLSIPFEVEISIHVGIQKVKNFANLVDKRSRGMTVIRQFADEFTRHSEFVHEAPLGDSRHDIVAAIACFRHS